jgi:GDSL-like Lipase/Acylhydrolase family
MAGFPLVLHNNLSDPDFLSLLRTSGNYKERSYVTHDTVHAPALAENLSDPIWCLLLGDSMLERLKTTGAHTKMGQGRFPQIFNAGVGGDRIRNVLYRLGTKNLMGALQARGVKHAILQMGTNDLRPKRRLSTEALGQYALILEAVHRASPEAKVLVTGLLPRKDVNLAAIDASNQDLEQLVSGYNKLTGKVLGMWYFCNPKSLSLRLLFANHNMTGSYICFSCS